MDKIITDKLIRSLNTICPDRVRTNIQLSDISSWRIGGTADCIVEPGSIEELQSIIRLAQAEGVPAVVFGAATNLLFADEGLRALGVRIGKHMSEIKIEGNAVTAEAGAWVPLLARKIGKAGLTGAEHIVGIPGTIGGLVCMNGGSARKNIGENVLSVTCVDFEGMVLEIPNSECRFSYRSSVFQQEKTQKIIARVSLNFPKRENPSAIRRKMLRSLEERKKKFPRKLPSCGSVFLNEPAMYEQIGPPGLVIEKCGLKGLRIGGAEVSRKHANFITNVSGASAHDILSLVTILQRQVFDLTGFLLKSEVRYVNQLGEITGLNTRKLQMNDPPKIGS